MEIKEIKKGIFEILQICYFLQIIKVEPKGFPKLNQMLKLCITIRKLFWVNQTPSAWTGLTAKSFKCEAILFNNSQNILIMIIIHSCYLKEKWR